MSKLGPGNTQQDIESKIQILTSSIPLIEISDIDPRRSKSRPRWHYGIRSRSDPIDIMKEVYKAVIRNGMKYKTIDTYRIRCIHSTVRKANVNVY
jgi:hypothetical protein